MNNPYFLSILIFSPLLGMFVIALVPSQMKASIKSVGFLATLLPLLLSLMAYLHFNSAIGKPQFTVSTPWIQIGNPMTTNIHVSIHYALGVDGLSLILILLTTLISVLAAAASMKIDASPKGYFLLFLLLEVGMLGVFASQNLLLFFAFFEMTLVPTYFLIAKWGLSNREKAANTFLIYNGLGSAVMLIAFLILFAQTGTMNIDQLQHFDFSKLGSSSPISHPAFRLGLLTAIIIAFGVKLPIFPLHTWMLNVHAEAPAPTVMIHSGILLKIGAYGLIRFGIGIFPKEFSEIAYILGIFGVINLLYGALIAFKQNELRLVLAYSSVSHMGIVLIGLAAVNIVGLQGAVFQVISHGLISALLFFLVGIFYERVKTTELPMISGMAKSMPKTAGFLLAGGLASLGLPGMSGFISEFMAFLGLFQHRPVLAAIGTLGILLTAVYVLRAIMQMIFGKTKQDHLDVIDLHFTEMWPAIIMIGCIIWIGVDPSIIAGSLPGSLHAIMTGLGG